MFDRDANGFISETELMEGMMGLGTKGSWLSGKVGVIRPVVCIQEQVLHCYRATCTEC